MMKRSAVARASRECYSVAYHDKVFKAETMHRIQALLQAPFARARLAGPLWRYAMAVLAASVGLLLRVPFWNELGASVPYITFFPAVAVCAWIAGLGPGVLCTVLSGVATVYALVVPGEIPANQMLGDALGLILFLCVGFFIAWLTESQTKARQLAEQRLRMLEQESKERKHAQHVAVEANKKLTAVIDASPLPIVALDAEGNVTLWNRSAQRLFGWTEAEVLGKPMPHVPEDKMDEFRLMRASDLLGDGFAERMIERRRKDGSRIPLAISTAPIWDDRGNVVATLAIYADLTELHRANATLMQTAEQLRQANRELEEFAFIASHDLQEPLRTVTIYTQLLTRRAYTSDPDAQESARYIISSVSRMQSLIGGVLSYSRMLHEDDHPSGSVDLEAALTEALTLLEGVLNETGAVIERSPLPHVRGNQWQFTQVFQNLLSNAVKYRKRDVPPRIRVLCHKSSSEWMISIEDNGIGFEQIYADRIFGLFKRLHNEEYSGTGLGLAICKRVIERHSGRIWAESNPGAGATFTFALPLYRVHT